jgi:RNA polymerase sigma-70 factor, ECF subfamily
MMIFLLTGPARWPTMKGVGDMPDPSRPPAPQVAALVDRARRRDPAAFRDLFQAHIGAVHRVVRRMVGPRADVEDLVQTAFVEAFRSLPDFRGDALFSTWLTRIAIRVTMRAARRRHPREASLDDVLEPASASAGPEQITAARETLALVETLLAELRPKRRAAFVLHVLEGYSMEEVAAILSASTAAVKVRVHDARRHIERRLKQNPAMISVLNRRGGEA